MRFFTGDFIVELTRWDQDKKPLKPRLDWVLKQFGIAKPALQSEIKQLLEELDNIEQKLLDRGIPQDFVERSQAERQAIILEMQEFCQGS